MITHLLSRLSTASYSELLHLLQHDLAQHQKFSPWLTLNASILSQADAAMLAWFTQARVCLADGIGVVALARRYRYIRPRRTGIHLAEIICASGLPVYCLGSRPAVIHQAVTRLKNQYPEFNCIGYQPGYHINWETLIRVLSEQPAIVLVGMGFPLQDTVLQTLVKTLPYGIGIGIGGAFDVLSGTLKRAPTWIQTCGCEWLYRAIQEPHRIKQWGHLVRFMRFFYQPKTAQAQYPDKIELVAK
mgnify:CR=1 FL=1